LATPVHVFKRAPKVVQYDVFGVHSKEIHKLWVQNYATEPMKYYFALSQAKPLFMGDR